jgi:NAD(P)-dependent dehydrogenase (short-subunit alcohol dehydrogenase family)
MKRKDLFDLQDRVVVITGGLGQIGRQFALELVDRGARVAIFNRRIPDQTTLQQRFPVDSGRIAFFAVDITRKASVKAGLDAVIAQWDVPHVLINNAGIDTQPSAPPEVSGPFEDFPEDVWREVLEVNMTGTFLCCQVIGGAMAKLGRGSIVNVGSIYGMLSPVQDIYAYKEELTGTPFIKPVAYCASKSGLYNFTRYLATYWGKKGVRVNILTPSGVRRDTQDAQFQANYCQRMPIGRMAEEDEYNGALVFLASDASRYMTGSNLVVDGGWTAW